MLRKPALIALLAAASLASGCVATSNDSDKAGGVERNGTVTLRMASAPWDLQDVPPLAAFARRVRALSGGSVRINVVNLWANYAPDAEAQVVRATESGAVDLGWAGSRVFDTLGVPAFQALSAPMLIDTYPLADAVLRSGLTSRMLTSLTGSRLTGLAVLGDELRYPIGVQHPLLAPSDWRGLSIGTYRSRAQADAIRALGANPVVAFGAYRDHAVANGTIQGFEFDVRRYDRDMWAARAPFVTANVALWAQFDVLFANSERLSSLSDEQRGWLQQAARDAAENSVGAAQERDSFVAHSCAAGAHFVTATPADLAAMRRAFGPVYQSLGQDRQTRRFVDQIQQLKTATPPGAGFDIPPKCAIGS
jgi:TRAP-type C4-dicarboxylate transport system substrate-binding protein